MSFSFQVKEELAQMQIQKPCCQLAALAAWIQVAGSLQLGSKRQKKITIVTENNGVARWGIALAKMRYGLESEIRISKARLNKRQSFHISLMGEKLDDFLYESGLLRNDGLGVYFAEDIYPPLIEKECCKKRYLRGAFLGCGSISDPAKAYHLEFVLRSENMANALQALLNSYELNAKVLSRKGTFVVYLKESDKIIEFLTRIEAHASILEYENVRVLKDFRNDLNRKVNCETANIQKTVTASTRQIENIQYLESQGGFASLNEDLREIAELRLENPEATLGELGEMLSIPIGKSGANHRLRKIEEIAKALRNEKGEQ